jgi:serine/threonine protein kinase
VTDVRRVDHRADLWSIAAIAYRCLLGRRPFEGDLSELLLHITHSPFAQPTQLAPRLNPAIDAFFERALAKAPADRFPDARSLAVAFRQALSRRS